ncbi:hypothetical protein Tco_0270478, partial [Tanacetum coccineum]
LYKLILSLPPSPDYVPGLEHPPSPDYVPGPKHPHSPDYVPGPKYPEYLVPSDDEVPIEDQPLPANASPTALSPGYVVDSDPFEEDPMEDPKEDPAEYPVDGGEDDDDNDDDDDDDDEDEEEEEEKHLASVDSTTLPVIDLVPSAKDTEAFKTDEFAPTPPRSPRLCRARIYIRPQTPMASSAKALIAEYASAPTPPSPPPSPLTPLSSPLPYIPSPPLPLPSPPTHTSLTYAESPLGYRASMIRSRAASPLSLPAPSPPLLLPSTTHGDDLPEADMPLQKRAHFTTPTGRFEVEESLSAVAARQTGHTLAHRVDYGFIDTMDASIHASESKAMTVVGEVNERREAVDARRVWAHYESKSQAIKAQIRALQKDVDVLQRQRIRDEDRLTSHIQHEHNSFRELVRTTKAGPQDGPADAGSSC